MPQDYYQSREFFRRKKRIKLGLERPRIVGETSVLTTFLQYFTKTSLKAFTKAGCETFLLIDDQVDVTDDMRRKVLDEFRPDIYYLVSHSRVGSTLPKAVSVISYVQDCCGPMTTKERIDNLIQPSDLFICQADGFKKYLTDKKVPEEQIMTEPVPVDHEKFFPAPLDFERDVVLVNHAYKPPQEMMDLFMTTHFGGKQSDKMRKFFEVLLAWLMCRDYVSEKEFTDHVFKKLMVFADNSATVQWRQLLHVFYVTVYYAYWREMIIKKLLKSGVKLEIYGNNWQGFDIPEDIIKGDYCDEEKRNELYNTSKVVLQLNPQMTMHQRVVEVALAGGLLVGVDLPEKDDWCQAKKYMGYTYFYPVNELAEKIKELILRREKGELEVELECNHREAFRNHSAEVVVHKILDKWRELL